MERKTFLLFKLVLLIGRSSAGSSSFCDMDTSVQVQTGNLGQISDFNWLGVLHVNLHDGRVKVSGIILIKDKYALVSAGDVTNIPENIFKKDSRAIFLLGPKTPWYATPASYVTHPEYGQSTLNSIAIIKLILNEEEKHPINPICLPLDDESVAYKHLYLTGLTNKNQKLEKVIYEIKYVDNKHCDKYYVSQWSPQEYMPSAYVCGYVPNLEEQCVWDIGMALVSNSTGYFSLIGFGVGDPSCSAPARFIHMFQYFQWIDSIICPDQVYDTDEDCGRRVREDTDDFESIPVHKLFRMSDRRQMAATNPKSSSSGPLKYHIVERSDNDKSISIAAFNASWEAYDQPCSSDMVSMRKENFELKATKPRGIVTYKLSLFEITPGGRSCVRVTVDCDDESGVIVMFKEGSPPATSSNSLLSFDMYHNGRAARDLGDVFDIRHDHHSDSTYVHETQNDSDLYITVEFTNKATLMFELWAVPEHSSVNPPLKLRVTRRPVKRTKYPSFWGVDNWAN